MGWILGFVLLVCGVPGGSEASPGEGRSLVDDATPYQPLPEAEAAFFEGNRLLKEGRAGEAIPRYEQALSLDPQLYRVRYYLAQALFQVARRASALEVLDAYLADPIGEGERAQALELRQRIAPAAVPGRGPPPREEGSGAPSSPSPPASPSPTPGAVAGAVMVGAGSALLVAGVLLLVDGYAGAVAAVEDQDQGAYGAAQVRYKAGLVLGIVGAVNIAIGIPVTVKGTRRRGELRVGADHISFRMEF